MDGVDPPPKTRPFVRDLGRCVLSNGLDSSCVTFNRCSPFIALLKNLNGKGPLHPDIPKLIQNAWKCGRDEKRRPQVCCPDPAIIPDKKPPTDNKVVTTPTTATTTTSITTTTTEEEITTTTEEEITTTTEQIPEEETTLSPTELDTQRFQNHPKRKLLAPSDTCGLPSAPPRILGGEDASLGQFPWLANIGYKFRSKPEVLYRCGGVLIGPQYVLTAAHCVNRLPRGVRPSTIRLGEHDLSKTEDCEEDMGIKLCADPVQNFEPEKIIPHPLYGKTPHNLHDIALVKLSEPVIENDFVIPICLPFTHDAEENYETSELAQQSIFTVAGWGATTKRGTHPADTLQFLEINVFNATQCLDVFRKRSSSVTPGNQICAGGEKNEDSCSGDSGSTLMQENFQQYTAVGIVSFGPKLCGTEGVPGVYTRVRNYMDWILDNLE
uniref:CLIP domain-containing serine protease n=1 Tax=Caligus clemensi TaxID=344056 RepID=C1C204_CALCM|nr:Serine protease easter precursor [Caligus clemensi]